MPKCHNKPSKKFLCGVLKLFFFLNFGTEDTTVVAFCKNYKTAGTSHDYMTVFESNVGVFWMKNVASLFFHK